MRRLGLLGGTFDPPHVAHLAIAEWAREQLRLDQVLFVPAAAPPHKRGRVQTPAAVRAAMTRLAVRGNPAFAVSTLELRRPGPSYTVDTLRALRRKLPGTALYLILGEDSLADLPAWHEPREIARLATLAVARRPGDPAARVRGIPAGSRVRWIEGPGLEVSSSLIRARARAGRSVRYLVPDAVARYLSRHRVYRRAAGAA